MSGLAELIQEMPDPTQYVRIPFCEIIRIGLIPYQLIANLKLKFKAD